MSSTPRLQKLTPALLTEALNRLEPRDRHLTALTDAHRILTSPQLTRLAFGADGTARARLRTLNELRVLARFRPRRDLGSAPWHYTLDAVGATILGADSGEELRRFRLEKRLGWAASQRLGHLTGINDLFTALAHTARHQPDANLVSWASGRYCTRWLDLVKVNPDGFGSWLDNGQFVDFFLEYDTGTEHLPQLAAKLPRYATLLAEQPDHYWTINPPRPWLLFVFHSPTREAGARRVLHHAAQQLPAINIATAALPHATAPAGPCWQPLPQNPHHQPRRHSLAELGQLTDHPRLPAGHTPTAPDDQRLAPAWPPLPAVAANLTLDPRPTPRSVPTAGDQP